jgi:hypothetical protein
MCTISKQNTFMEHNFQAESESVISKAKVKIRSDISLNEWDKFNFYNKFDGLLGDVEVKTTLYICRKC